MEGKYGKKARRRGQQARRKRLHLKGDSLIGLGGEQEVLPLTVRGLNLEVVNSEQKHLTLNSILCTLYLVQMTLQYTVNSVLCSVHCTVYSLLHLLLVCGHEAVPGVDTLGDLGVVHLGEKAVHSVECGVRSRDG